MTSAIYPRPITSCPRTTRCSRRSECSCRPRLTPVTYSAAAVLRIEAQALTQAAARVDETLFRSAVEVLLAATGHIHVLGAGTSGIVARKLAATLTSTGTPA